MTTVTQCLIWKGRVSKRGILKSLVSHVLNFESWIKLIYDKITYIYFVINEFKPTFEVQKMGNEAFQMPCLETPRFQMATRVTVVSGLHLYLYFSLDYLLNYFNGHICLSIRLFVSLYVCLKTVSSNQKMLLTKVLTYALVKKVTLYCHMNMF